ncbi:hypothetical protein D3C86_2035980 [compost metagenome]
MKQWIDHPDRLLGFHCGRSVAGALVGLPWRAGAVRQAGQGLGQVIERRQAQAECFDDFTG